MKRFLKSLTVLLVSLVAVLPLTSCEDEYVADTLQGTWEGNMYVQTAYLGQHYTATYTEIEFLLDPFRYTKGSGYWVDYYSDAPYDYVANHIDWRVDDGRIEVYFREEGYTVYIDDYRLTDDRFVGTLYDNGQYVNFSLRHTSSPNWGNYEWGYHYIDGWAKQRPDFTRSDADTTATEKPRRMFGK